MTPDVQAFSSCTSIESTCTAAQPWRCPCPDDSSWDNPKAALCNRVRPLPARRRSASCHIIQLIHNASRRGRLQCSLWMILLCLLAVCPGASADRIYGVSEVFPHEQLLFDRSPPPILDSPYMQLDRRHHGLGLASTATVVPEASTTATGTIQMETSSAPVTLPRPFDTTIGNNFTSSTCPAFFGTFLNNKTFQECLPFSLLLQTSSSFFSISRSLLRLTQTLDATCNVNFDDCSALMASLAEDIQNTDACGADLEMQNPVVTQAYNGFVAYPTLYHAGCLADVDGNYCFADAVTNASSPSSSYIYYLPLGVQLPGGARPTCDQCLERTMAIFAQTATNASQPLSSDYGSAAQQIQMSCGPTFVETVVASSTASPSSTTSSSLAGILLLAALLVNIL